MKTRLLEGVKPHPKDRQLMAALNLVLPGCLGASDTEVRMHLSNADGVLYRELVAEKVSEMDALAEQLADLDLPQPVFEAGDQAAFIDAFPELDDGIG